jgi:alanine dehydrogenase
MRLIRSDDVDALASVELGLAAAREAAELVAREALSTGRVQIGNQHAWTRVLVGILPDLDIIGYKQFHRVGQSVRYHVSLFRHSDGEALGIVDGRRITSLRTSSTAALSVAHLFGDEPIRLAVLGSGEEAREGMRAIHGSATLASASIFSPTVANRDALAGDMAAQHGVEAHSAASAAEALEGADVAYVATSSQHPFVAAADVAHVRLVAAVGATRPDHHELRGDVLGAAAEVVVDCADALHEPGDVVDALEAGWDPTGAALLGDWLGRPPPAANGSPVVFKSIGSVEQDLVLARRLLSAAEEQGRGEEVEDIGSLRTMR